MDIFLILITMIMVYLYGLVFYFYKRSKYQKQKKSTMMMRAVTHFRRKNFQQAQYYLEEVYAEAINSEDAYYAAESLYYLALVNIEKRNSQNALEFLEESLVYYQHLENDDGIQKTQNLLAKFK